MKNQLKKMSDRDKIILTIFAFFIAFAGLYLLHGKFQEEKAMLQQENEVLEQKRIAALKNKAEIEGLEKLRDAKKVETLEIYSKVPNDVTSSIEFERLFLGWINGRNVKVVSFSYDGPSTEVVSFPQDSENEDVATADGLQSAADQIDALNGVYDDEEEEPSEPEESVTPPSDDDEEADTPSEPETPPAIDVSKYSYKLELSRYEYTRLLDKINNKSEFYHLKATDFTQPDEGPGQATLIVSVYAYDKPKSLVIEGDK